MTTVTAYEAKTHLPRLIRAVERGETILITRHGRPVARLGPVEMRDPSEWAQLEAGRRALRRRLPRLSLADLLADRHAHHRF